MTCHAPQRAVLRIFVVQVPLQEKKSGQMNRAALELVKRSRKPQDETRDPRPLQRGVLAVSEAFAAVGV